MNYEDLHWYLTSKMNEYGDDLVIIPVEILRSDVIELYQKLRTIPIMQTICDRLIKLRDKDIIHQDELAFIIAEAQEIIDSSIN